MVTLRKKATAIVAVCLIACGAYFYVQAQNNNVLQNIEVENLVDPILKPIADPEPEVYWLELEPTTSEFPEDQKLLNGIPMTNPPAESNSLDCAQEFNYGDYCAVALLFSVPNPDLTGYTTVKDVIDNHPDCLGIAENDLDIDADGDGYSRMPL